MERHRTYLSSNSAYRFNAFDMLTSPDGGRFMYAAVTAGNRLGLAIFDAQRDTAYGVITTDGRPIHMDLSPSGKRISMTTSSSDWLSSSNYLFDVAGRATVLQTFARHADASPHQNLSRVVLRSDKRERPSGLARLLPAPRPS